jgi:hypothetical protein
LLSQSLVLSHTYTVLQPDERERLEEKIDQRHQYIPTGLSMTSHTLLKQRKYSLLDLNPTYMPSHVYGITKRILFHSKARNYK